MARTRGNIGPGSAKMGGGGAKPGAPRTPMAGAPAGGVGIGGGGGKPPGLGPAGMPTPSPGGSGMSGGGFAKGGVAKKFAKGGGVSRETDGFDLGSNAKPRMGRKGKFE